LPSRLLLLSTLVAAAATFAIPFLGAASTMFGFVPMSASELMVVVLIVGGYIAATELAKHWYFRDRTAAASPARQLTP
jgi:Mg2+-importing ATPase